MDKKCGRPATHFCPFSLRIVVIRLPEDVLLPAPFFQARVAYVHVLHPQIGGGRCGTISDPLHCVAWLSNRNDWTSPIWPEKTAFRTEISCPTAGGVVVFANGTSVGRFAFAITKRNGCPEIAFNPLRSSRSIPSSYVLVIALRSTTGVCSGKAVFR